MTFLQFFVIILKTIIDGITFNDEMIFAIRPTKSLSDGLGEKKMTFCCCFKQIA